MAVFEEENIYREKVREQLTKYADIVNSCFWEYNENEYEFTSNCGFNFFAEEKEDCDFKFCPYCGKKLRM